MRVIIKVKKPVMITESTSLTEDTKTLAQKRSFQPPLGLVQPNLGHIIFLSFQLYYVLDMLPSCNPVQY